MTDKKWSIRSVRKLPPRYKGTPRPAIAVAGRSNVGKSTLINTLLHQKVAATSKTPGRTRGVYRYLVNDQYDLVDLPGYGYAKVGETLRRSWREQVSDFLSGHGNLRCLLILVDGRRGISELDSELLGWAEREEVDVAIVLTKMDKLPKQQGIKAVKDVKNLIEDEVPLFPVSALKKTGINDLIRAMRLWWSEDRFG